MGASRDAALADLAAEQHGLVSQPQTLELGLTPQARQRRVASGLLVERSPLVFAIRGAPVTPQQELLAAVFDAGAGAVATRRSGATLWGVPGFRWPKKPEILTKRGGDHLSRLGSLSETSWLPAHHVTEREGIPVVTLARLCFELAATEHPKRTERAVDNALNMGMTLESFAEVVGSLAKRGRPGSAVSRKLVADRGEGYVPPASALEALGFEVLRAAGLPDPVRQLDVGGSAWVGRVDCAYPAARLLIEFDGRRHWQVLLEAQADRRRDAELVAAGWRVLRITWEMLTTDPEGVVRLVRDALRSAA